MISQKSIVCAKKSVEIMVAALADRLQVDRILICFFAVSANVRSLCALAVSLQNNNRRGYCKCGYHRIIHRKVESTETW